MSGPDALPHSSNHQGLTVFLITRTTSLQVKDNVGVASAPQAIASVQIDTDYNSGRDQLLHSRAAAALDGLLGSRAPYHRGGRVGPLA